MPDFIFLSVSLQESFFLLFFFSAKRFFLHPNKGKLHNKKTMEWLEGGYQQKLDQLVERALRDQEVDLPAGDGGLAWVGSYTSPSTTTQPQDTTLTLPAEDLKVARHVRAYWQHRNSSHPQQSPAERALEMEKKRGLQQARLHEEEKSRRERLRKGVVDNNARHRLSKGNAAGGIGVGARAAAPRAALSPRGGGSVTPSHIGVQQANDVVKVVTRRTPGGGGGGGGGGAGSSRSPDDPPAWLAEGGGAAVGSTVTHTAPRRGVSGGKAALPQWLQAP